VSPKSIGAATALSIASQSPSLLVLASRTESNISAVAASIQAAHPDVPLLSVPLDLSSFSAVRAAAASIASALGPDGALDVLVNNAGINVPTHQFTADGHELQWQTNHLGPFLLTALLAPALRAAARNRGAARVVNVSSAGHVLCPVRFSDTGFTRSIDSLPEEERPAKGRLGMVMPKQGETYSGFLAYAQGKTANVLMAVHMARELGKEGIQAFSVHPGCGYLRLCFAVGACG
jgi:NAD(P)-dependent dehydrogenase (short-subunit alcohol dehydrogenase family)